MAQAANLATAHLAQLLRGIRAPDLTWSDCTPPFPDEGSILELQAPADLVDKTTSLRYPLIYVYCNKITNSLKEKFRRFSGTAELNIEVRVSHDHLNVLQTELQAHVQTITDLLESHHGNWTEDAWYMGGYEVIFSPAKRGGRNFIQSARVSLEVHLHVN